MRPVVRGEECNRDEEKYYAEGSTEEVCRRSRA